MCTIDTCPVYVMYNYGDQTTATSVSKNETLRKYASLLSLASRWTHSLLELSGERDQTKLPLCFRPEFFFKGLGMIDVYLALCFATIWRIKLRLVVVLKRHRSQALLMPSCMDFI